MSRLKLKQRREFKTRRRKKKFHPTMLTLPFLYFLSSFIIYRANYYILSSFFLQCNVFMIFFKSNFWHKTTRSSLLTYRKDSYDTKWLARHKLAFPYQRQPVEHKLDASFPWLVYTRHAWHSLFFWKIGDKQDMW